MSTIQYSLTRQFCMITNSLLQSLRIGYSFVVFHSVESSTAHCSHSTVASV